MRRSLIAVLTCAVLLAVTPGIVGAVTEPVSVDPVFGVQELSAMAGNENDPAVSDGVVAWVNWGDNGVYFEDLAAESGGLVYGSGFSRQPDIDDGCVVWEEYSADSFGDVWMKDLESGSLTQVANRGGVGEKFPAIDGDLIAWCEGDDDTGYYVGGVDLSGPTTFTVDIDPVFYPTPDVSGDSVVFAAEGEVAMYDVPSSTVTTISPGPSMRYSPAISGDVIVWVDDRNGNLDIYGYDLSTATEFPVCTATGDQEIPSISGDVVVWQDKRGGTDWDVYAYDLSTQTEWVVCADAANQSLPATDGSVVVWVDSRNAGVTNGDIWRAGYDTVAPTTTSDLGDHVGVTAASTSGPKATYTGSATIELFAEDGPLGSGVDKTWYKVDYVGAWYDGPFTVTRPGRHTLHHKSYDVVGNLEDYNVEYFDLISEDTVYTAIEGATRYDTAIASSQKAFPKGACSVVIATGVNWPDALGGAALAKAKHAPILLTAPTALPASVIEEIDRLGASEAIILGGEGAVSSAVESALKTEFGEDKVARIGGATRYETADMVAKATYEAMGYSPYKVFVATGANFPDALGASPLAALGPYPIVLAPEGQGLTAGTKATIEEIGSGYGVILGGEGAVSATAESELAEMFGEGKVTRLAGDTRYDTAIECAKFGVAHGLWWDGVAISTGANFPDALAGGILQGEAGSVLLLTPTGYLHPTVAAELKAQRDWIGNVTYLGGTGAVSQTVRDEVSSILK